MHACIHVGTWTHSYGYIRAYVHTYVRETYDNLKSKIYVQKISGTHHTKQSMLPMPTISSEILVIFSWNIMITYDIAIAYFGMH